MVKFCFRAALGLAMAVAPLWVGAQEQAAAVERPHIVIMLADDLGWRDLGYHGSEIATPNIDRLAAEGVELNRFYAQPTCSPTRAALMTGKSPLRFGLTRPIAKNETRGLPLDETILPQHLAGLGYQPLMVGKWHLGHYLPDHFPHRRGFEHFYGLLTGGVGYWDHNHGGGHDWQRNGETLRETGYATRLLADEAIRVLASRDRSRPTFLYLAFTAPHLPNEAPPESVAPYQALDNPLRRLHAGMVAELDEAVGRVVAALAAEGMLDNTLILFFSDNGGLVEGTLPGPLNALAQASMWLFDRPAPHAGLEFMIANTFDGGSDNRPPPSGKGSIAEGGARVPAALWWPGRLEPGKFEGFMSASDVLPTLFDAVGAAAAVPPDLDGRSQWPALTGTEAGRAVPDYVTADFDGNLALYRAPWKLIDGEPPRLYNVYEDPLETQDLAERHPDIVEALKAAADTWPRGRPSDISLLEVFLDPDTFGGGEDREPWADVARKRAAGEG